MSEAVCHLLYMQTWPVLVTACVHGSTNHYLVWHTVEAVLHCSNGHQFLCKQGLRAMLFPKRYKPTVAVVVIPAAAVKAANKSPRAHIWSHVLSDSCQTASYIIYCKGLCNIHLCDLKRTKMNGKRINTQAEKLCQQLQTPSPRLVGQRTCPSPDPQIYEAS